MKNYIVVYMFKGSPFHERFRVYDAESRNDAVKAVRRIFGRGAITIVSARTIKYDENGWEVL